MSAIKTPTLYSHEIGVANFARRLMVDNGLYAPGQNHFPKMVEKRRESLVKLVGQLSDDDVVALENIARLMVAEPTSSNLQIAYDKHCEVITEFVNRKAG